MVGSTVGWTGLVRGHSLLKGDSLLIKRINQMAILRFVQQHEPSSRYDIARACGLSNSTVSTLRICPEPSRRYPATLPRTGRLAC